MKGLPKGMQTGGGWKDVPGVMNDLAKHPPDRRNKHNNKRTEIDGIWFQSAAEARRYVEVKLLERAGAISNLVLQPRFVLQEAYTDSKGDKVRKIEYVADFAYHENGVEVVEDVKGHETRVFKNKSKWFRKLYPEKDFRVLKA